MEALAQAKPCLLCSLIHKFGRKDVDPKPGRTKTDTCEDETKRRFIKEPSNRRLLVVVDKFLTGFDAPSRTCLYIDKSMQEHGLFQSICRTNRVDGDDKAFGYSVNFKGLFDKVLGALAVFTSELDHSAPGTSPEVLLQDRLKKGRECLDQAFETMALLCDGVEPPKGEFEYIHRFCGNTEFVDEPAAHELQRVALYKATSAFGRAYGEKPQLHWDPNAGLLSLAWSL